jgi:hypothetical protein
MSTWKSSTYRCEYHMYIELIEMSITYICDIIEVYYIYIETVRVVLLSACINKIVKERVAGELA